MKKSINFFAVAFAAIVMLGSITLASCQKEDLSVLENQKGIQSEAPALKNTKKIFPINQYFTDSEGTLWYVWGEGHGMNTSTIAFDIKFRHAFGSATADNRVWAFDGTVKIYPDGSCQITGATFRMTPELERFFHDFACYWLGL